MYAHQERSPFFNLLLLEMLVPRNVSILDTSTVSFIFKGWLFACSMNCAISALFLVQSKHMLFQYERLKMSLLFFFAP